MQNAKLKNPVNITVFGYGKVGRILVQLLESDTRFYLNSIIDRSDPGANFSAITADSLKGTDVIIDFSHGESVLEIVKKVSEINPKVRIVTGSSGWNNVEKEVKDIVHRNSLYFLYGANFSIGTALYMRIVNNCAELFNKFEGFDVSLLDIHHRHKKDMPSGTAKKIAAGLLERTNSKKSILYGMADRPIKADELHVNCLRTGENMGFHEVAFDSAEEVIKISQQSRDRGAYAKGSMEAALWLMEKKSPGYFTFDQHLEERINK